MGTVETLASSCLIDSCCVQAPKKLRTINTLHSGDVYNSLPFSIMAEFTEGYIGDNDLIIPYGH